MNCEQCDAPLVDGACPACEAEERMYAAYGRGIEVPPMWPDIATRLRAEVARRPVRWMPLAAAAVLAAIAVAAILALRVPHDRQPAQAPRTVDVAAASYRAAIARLEPRGAGAGPLLPQLDAALAAAERAAARAPNDPIAVTGLIAAYDAKLQVLRANVHD